jgi:hypothetical protein
MISEANYIAKALNKNVTFALSLMKISSTMKLVIIVDNKDQEMRYEWNPEKFRLRLVIFREMLDDLLDDGVMQKFSDPLKDPFWDPKEAQNAYPDGIKGKGMKGPEKSNSSSCCNIY